MREVLRVLEVCWFGRFALPIHRLALFLVELASWETALDATASLMNQLAGRLSDVRSKALEQIKALGWPADVYNDIAWYPDLLAEDATVTKPPKMSKKAARAEQMRNSVFQIDVALAALNQFAETTDSVPSSNEPDAIVEAFEASINAIEALLASDADIGKRQREHGSGGGWNYERREAQRTIYQAWADEDNRLQSEKPRLNISARAKHIAANYNRRSEKSNKPVSWETVRSALRRLRT